MAFQIGARFAAAAFATMPFLLGCGRSSGPAPAVGSPQIVNGDRCDAGPGIAGVPATVAWHQTVHAVLYRCAYTSGFGPKTWQRASSADWYLSNTNEAAGGQLVAQNAGYDFTFPMPGNSLPGKYLLVAREAAYTYATPPAEAAVTFTVTPSNDPSEAYPGSPMVRALAAAIGDGFQNVRGATLGSDGGATTYASRVQLPDMQCTIVSPKAARPYATCVAADTAADSADRYKDVFLLALPKLSAANVSNGGATKWSLTDATTAIAISQIKTPKGYGVQIVFEAPALR